MFPEEQSKLIYMQHTGSLPLTAADLERKSFGAFRHNMGNISTYTQHGDHVLNYSTAAAAAAVFLHPFSKCSSVAAAAAG